MRTPEEIRDDDGPARTECRRCTECEGEEHHWMVILGEAESDGDDITIPCKHCDATTHGVDCEACGEIVPAAVSHLCEEDGTWLCGSCAEDMTNDA